MNTWQTEPSGLVVVDDGHGPSVIYPPLDAATVAKLDGVRIRWGVAGQQAAASAGAPWSWVLATVYAESGGDPGAHGADGEIGLMQIMPATGAGLGFTAAQLADPVQNLRCGATLLGRSAARGLDLPKAASCYNAGAQSNGQPHTSSSSPWGIAESSGYIARVVAAANYYLGVQPATKAGLDTVELAFLGLAALLGYRVLKG